MFSIGILATFAAGAASRKNGPSAVPALALSHHNARGPVRAYMLRLPVEGRASQ
jgi:hypothetical protein